MVDDVRSNDGIKLIRKIVGVAVFSLAMAFVEAAVVVYLRAIYYPQGFAFPLKQITNGTFLLEPFRELATMLMLFSVAFLTGRRRWERFAYFLFTFGMWDIFYYIWLKVAINWPLSIFEWDILFLIPLPWIAPVIAPLSISLLMVVPGFFIIYSFHRGYDFKPILISRVLVLIGTAFILFSFMHDTAAAFHQQLPQPYRYELLIVGEFLYATAFVLSYLKTIKKRR